MEIRRLGTLVRKQGIVLAADDEAFFLELRAFLRWVLADPQLASLAKGLLEPPEEVHVFRKEIPGLLDDARNVAHWLKTEAPSARAEIGNDAHWAEFDRLLGMVQDPSARTLRELSEISEALFTTLRAVRDAVGRSSMGKNDDERLAAWRTAVDLINVFDHRTREREAALEVSAGTALTRLIALCRAIAAPPEGVAHWTDFTPVDAGGRFGVRALQAGLRESPEVWVAFGRRAFTRFVEGLVTSIEESVALTP